MTPAGKRSRLKGFAALLGKTVAVALAFVTVTVLSGYFTMRLALQAREITVPDVAGMTLRQAEEALGGRELYLEVAAEKHDSRVDQGRVLAQDPPAGAALKKFRKVKVVTSLGPKLFKIPDLSGHLLRSALVRLEAEGLRPGRIAHAHTSIAETDQVVSQDPPPAGESLGHSGVSLLVSKGPRRAVYVMPDLRGRRLSDVARRLETRGLKLGAVRREPHAWLARGAIAEQYPRPGYPVASGDSISLVVTK